MNHHPNRHEVSSQNSNTSNYHGEHRIALTNLFKNIRRCLNHDFQHIYTNRSIIMNLSEVLNEVRIFKNSLNHVEFGFYLAMQFFVKSFPYLMHIMNRDIIAIHATHQQFQLSENEFNVLDEEHRQISDSICQLKIDETFQDAQINNLQHKIIIGFNNVINNEDLQHNLHIAFNKKEGFQREIEELNVCYNHIMKKITDGHNNRSKIQSEYHEAELKYEEAINIKTNLIEAWTDLQTFIHI